MKRITRKYTIAEYVYSSSAERNKHALEMREKGWEDSGQVKCSAKEIPNELLSELMKAGDIQFDKQSDLTGGIIFSPVYFDYAKYYHREK